MTRPIAIATCDQLPEGDPDDQLLVTALAELGLRPSLLAWSAPEVDWTAYEATVIRSTWDYTARRTEFLAWADRVPRLHNPAAVIHANSDKRYLADLAAAGLPVVPTVFVAPGESAELPGSGEFVVKPSVGAGSRGAGRFDADRADTAELAAAHLLALHQAGRTAMIQPYLSGVDTAGETALIFIDGRFSHSVCKSAMLPPDSRHPVTAGELYVAETITVRQPSAAELAVAEEVLKQLTAGGAEPLLYARIDLLPSPDGPRVVEAELTEPSLFLSYADGAANRLAEAIRARTD